MRRNNRTNPYFMPAEWLPHERTLVSWPVRESLIRPERYGEVAAGYANAIRAIARFEPVTVLVNPGQEREAEEACGGGSVSFLTVAHNDAWLRDNGPTFVIDAARRRTGIHWKFNAWGEKYRPYELDAAAAPRLLQLMGLPCAEAPLVLEGGSIHTDGEGTLLTTEQCLLSPNRNPSLTREAIAEVLKRYLGVSEIIWLKRGLSGDETDGHVDNVACFAEPGTVLLQVCRTPGDPNEAAGRENREILRKARDARGRSLKVVELLQPPARFCGESRLALSYLNFYLVNGGVILPVFGGDAAETDRLAAETLERCFPERTVVPVDGMPLIREGGNIHCITQQVPAGGEEEEGICGA